jgi:hypothetical protein
VFDEDDPKNLILGLSDMVYPTMNIMVRLYNHLGGSRCGGLFLATAELWMCK